MSKAPAAAIAATSPSAAGGAATNTAAQVIGAAGGGPLALASIGGAGATGGAGAVPTGAPGHSLQNSDSLLKQHNETTYYARLQEERTLRKDLQISIQTERRERKAAETALAESQAAEAKAQADLAAYKSSFQVALADAKRAQKEAIEAEMESHKQAHLRQMAENEARQRRMQEGSAAEQRRALEDKIRESLAVKFAEQAAADREFLTRQVADRDQRLERLSAQCNDLVARNASVTEALHRQLDHRRKLIDKLQGAIENGVRLRHMQTVFKYLLVSQWVRCRRMHVFLLRLHKRLFAHVSELHARNEALLASDQAASRSRIGFLNQSEMPLWLQRGKVWVRRINGTRHAPPIAHWTNVELATAATAAAASSPTSPALTASASTPTASHRSVPSLGGLQLDPRELMEDDDEDEDAFLTRGSGSGAEGDEEEKIAAVADSPHSSAHSTPVRGSLQQQQKRKPTQARADAATLNASSSSSNAVAAASSSPATAAAAASPSAAGSSSSTAVASAPLLSPGSSRLPGHQSGLVHPSSRRHGSGVISVAESGAYKFSSGSAAAAQAQQAHAVTHRKGGASMQLHNRAPSTMNSGGAGRPKHSSQLSAFAVGGGLFPVAPTDAAALAAAAFAARQKRMDPSQTRSAYAPEIYASSSAVVYPPSSSAASSAAAAAPLVRKWLPRLHEDELCSHLSDVPALLSAQARTSCEREDFYKTNSEGFFQRSSELAEQLRAVEAERTQLASALKFLKGRLEELEGGAGGGGASGSGGGKASEGGAASASSLSHAGGASQKALGGGAGASNPAAAALQAKLSAQESSNTSLRSALAIETHRAAVLQERVQILQASNLLLSSNRIPRSGRDFAEEAAAQVGRMNAVERREWIERDEEARAQTLSTRKQRRATATAVAASSPAPAAADSQSSNGQTDEKVNSRGGNSVGTLSLPPIAQHGGGGRASSPPSSGSRSARDLRASPTHRALASDQPVTPASARASRSSLRHSGVGSSPVGGGTVSGGALKTLKSSPYKQLHSDASSARLHSTPQKPQPIPTISAALASPSSPSPSASPPSQSQSSPLKAPVISTPRSRSKRHTLPSAATSSSASTSSGSPVAAAAAAAATAAPLAPGSPIHEGEEQPAHTTQPQQPQQAQELAGQPAESTVATAAAAPSQPLPAASEAAPADPVAAPSSAQAPQQPAAEDQAHAGATPAAASSDAPLVSAASS